MLSCGCYAIKWLSCGIMLLLSYADVDISCAYAAYACYLLMLTCYACYMVMCRTYPSFLFASDSTPRGSGSMPISAREVACVHSCQLSCVLCCVYVVVLLVRCVLPGCSTGLC